MIPLLQSRPPQVPPQRGSERNIVVGDFRVDELFVVRWRSSIERSRIAGAVRRHCLLAAARPHEHIGGDDFGTVLLPLSGCLVIPRARPDPAFDV